MAKTKTPIINNEQVKLVIDRISAETKIKERIHKGEEIKKISINSESQLDIVKNDYYKWSSYNRELLKQMFSNDSVEKSYSNWGGICIATSRVKSLHEKINDLYKDINDTIHRLDTILEKLELYPVLNSSQNEDTTISLPVPDRKKVFVVHGRDEAAKHEVGRFIEKLDFTPIILHEQENQGKTIIEKIEEYSEVGFGVVIYTPCDLGGLNSSEPVLKERARQNVVFEHGYLIGKLGRSKVCSLVKDNVETPNDISGIVYVNMSSDWKLTLAKELKAAGYAVDMNKVI